ncbi:MAG: hypothetical protein JWM04_2783 [Verrucomicrobiales bacterium]|nr:hypothetical protein [Verrucomicrobiales bacterium]
MRIQKPLLILSIASLSLSPAFAQTTSREDQEQALRALRQKISELNKTESAPTSSSTSKTPAAKVKTTTSSSATSTSSTVSTAPASLPPVDTEAQRKALEALRQKESEFDKNSASTTKTTKPTARDIVKDAKPEPAPKKAVVATPAPEKKKEVAPAKTTLPAPAALPPVDTEAQARALQALRNTPSPATKTAAAPETKKAMVVEKKKDSSASTTVKTTASAPATNLPPVDKAAQEKALQALRATASPDAKSKVNVAVEKKRDSSSSTTVKTTASAPTTNLPPVDKAAQEKALQALRAKQSETTPKVAASVVDSQINQARTTSKSATTTVKTTPSGTATVAAEKSNLPPVDRDAQARALQSLRQMENGTVVATDSKGVTKTTTSKGSTTVKITNDADKKRAADVDKKLSASSKKAVSVPSDDAQKILTAQEAARKARTEEVALRMKVEEASRKAQQAELEASRLRTQEMARQSAAARAQSQVAVKPVSKPDTMVSSVSMPAMTPKQSKLADLLRRYKADEFTPKQYQEQRAKILAEP